MKSFDINSLNLDELLSNDELVSIDAGAFINVPKGIDSTLKPVPGYTEATIIWSQIP